jgi:hypothetical protein
MSYDRSGINENNQTSEDVGGSIPNEASYPCEVHQGAERDQNLLDPDWTQNRANSIDLRVIRCEMGAKADDNLRSESFLEKLSAKFLTKIISIVKMKLLSLPLTEMPLIIEPPFAHE